MGAPHSDRVGRHDYRQDAISTTSRRDLAVAIGGLMLAAILIVVANTSLAPRENRGTVA